MFLDEAIIRVRSGQGGNGCVSFRREKFVPRGGPNGGNGGNGGSVYLTASENVSTLLDLGRRRFYAAENGRPGEGSDRYGKRGKDLVLEVPVGTLVREVIEGVEPREGRLIGDLVDPTKRLRVARGGRGGLGNRAFASATNQVPRQAEEGGPAEERKIYLELKLMADVGLVGLPNAGKSTLLARLSAATPKIADYPFTTLKPNLGIVELGDWSRLVFADIPGLIEGAHSGQGLGIEFLRHIERTRVLVHLIAAESLDVDAWVEDYRTIEAELAQYSETLAEKRRLVVLSKSDTVPAEELEGLLAKLSAALDREVLSISGVLGTGLEPFLLRARQLVHEGEGEIVPE